MTTRPFDAEQFVRDYKSGTAKLTAAYGYNPAQEIDSCGVGLIIVANNVTSSRNTKLYLSNIKPFIVKIFEIMRISKHLVIFDKEDDALQAIKSGK